MQRITICVSIVVLFIAAISLFAVEKIKVPMQQNMSERSFTGYLSDQMCGVSGKDPMGDDLFMNPGKNTVANMKTYAKSGFGIFIKEANGKFAYHKFDANGSNMAKKEILEKTTMKSNIMVTAKGTMQKDGMINVKSIMIYKPATKPAAKLLPPKEAKPIPVRK
jgi:hypothetical protein